MSIQEICELFWRAEMITIQKSSELNGAQKFGQCINCGVNSKDADI